MVSSNLSYLVDVVSRDVSSNLSYLVDVVSRDGIVEGSVEVVQKVDNIDGGAVCGEGGEADDVGEIDGDAGKHLWRHCLAQLQLIRNYPAATRVFVLCCR